MALTRIPLFPLGLVLLPKMSLPLHIFEERYKQMIAECLEEDLPFGIVWFDGRAIRSVGCTARVTEVLSLYEDGRMDILTRGEKRFVTRRIVEEKAYMEAEVTFFDDEDALAADDAAEMLKTGRSLLQALADTGEPIDLPDRPDLNDPKRLSFAIAAMEGVTHAERQVFLEMTSSQERLKKSLEALAQILERIQLTRQIKKIIGGNGHPPDSSIRKLIGELS
jgi:Lon protease-like protein